MPKHACETYDFPVAVGLVNYTVTKKISQKGGGTWQIAVQEAIDEAKQQAEDDGNKALKNDTCDPPCECLVFVDVSLDRIAPTWVAGKKGKAITIPVTGVWKAGILCIKPAKKSDGKSEEKSEKKSGEKSEDKPKDKSGEKSKGKPKSGRKSKG